MRNHANQILLFGIDMLRVIDEMRLEAVQTVREYDNVGGDADDDDDDNGAAATDATSASPSHRRLPSSRSGRAAAVATQQLSMRIGIHTGTGVGGVIGVKKPRFYVWGRDALVAK
jgi:class 3 adenylate cyclase